MNKKKYIVSWLVIVCIIMSMTVSAFATTDSLYLTCYISQQEQTNWCCCATSQSVINYLASVSPAPTQTQIHQAATGNTNNTALSLAQDKLSLTAFNVSTTQIASTLVGGSSSTGYLSFSDIVNMIKGWYSPIKAGVYYFPIGSAGGHSLVIYGYYQDYYTQNVSYLDPGNASYHSVPYNSFVSNATWRWYDTCYNNKKAS